MSDSEDKKTPGEVEKQKKAVAIANQPGDRQLPRIVASGCGLVAEQILEIAFAQGVRIREDADLIEILGGLDVDSEIPLEALAAVAEILAYVYRANGALPPPDDAPIGNGSPSQ
jgi:flagellar biosynthesis protein